ncbi:hypothetical protein Tco_0556195 [Tanacetum coccineum]
MKCPQHYLTDIQEVILFYNGLDVPTRQILDSKGAIPSKTAVDAKTAIQEMAGYSQKWHNGTSSRTRNEQVLQERGFGSLPSSTEINPRDQVKSISTAKADFSEIRHFINLGLNPRDNDVPLILERPFLSTAHSKIDVFKRKITLRVVHDKKFYQGTTLTFRKPFTKIHSKRRLFDTTSLVESNSPKIDLTSRNNQRKNGSEHEDANEHIEKVLEIVDLFHIPKVTQDQIMLRAFPVSLTRAASRWLRNQPSGSITTWEGPGFYQQNNGNSSYPDRRLRLEESLTKFMAESAKRYEENSNIIKEIRASTDAAIRNRGASIKTLEIQIGQMSKVLQERGFGSRPNYTEINPRDQVKSISTAKANFSGIRRIGHTQQEHNV